MRTLLAVTLASLLGLQGLISSPEPVWEELTPMPEGRSGMIAFITEQSEPAYYGGSSWDENGKRIHASGYALRNGQWRPLESLQSPLNPSAEVSQFAQGSWHPIARLPEGSLINPAACSWKGSILVIGGGLPSASGLKNTDAVFSFELKGKTWTRLAKLPTPTRGAAALSIPDHGALVIGGYFDPPGFSSQVQLLDLEKNEFVSLAKLPIGLMLPAVIKTEKWVYVFGGEDAPRHRSKRVFRAALSRLLPEISIFNTNESLAERIEVRSFHSQALGREVPFAVILPSLEASPKGWPTLFLLHGRGRNHLSLSDGTQSRATLLEQPYLIVLPATFDGWYVNSPVDSNARYGDALKELEAIVASDYPIQNNRNARAIMGWSMGGFGALRHATYRPERYAFAGSIIGLLDFPRANGLPEGQRYEIPISTFGSDPGIWRDFNPRLHIGALRNTRVFLAIGEHAFDRTMNENFLRDARQASIDIRAIHLPHAHTFQAVQEALPLVLDEVRKHFTNVDALSS